jgi:hypothetical protein
MTMIDFITLHFVAWKCKQSFTYRDTSQTILRIEKRLESNSWRRRKGLVILSVKKSFNVSTALHINIFSSNSFHFDHYVKTSFNFSQTGLFI